MFSTGPSSATCPGMLLVLLHEDCMHNMFCSVSWGLLAYDMHPVTEMLCSSST